MEENVYETVKIKIMRIFLLYKGLFCDSYGNFYRFCIHRHWNL